MARLARPKLSYFTDMRAGFARHTALIRRPRVKGKKIDAHEVVAVSCDVMNLV